MPEINTKRGVTPEMAQSILAGAGMCVSLEKAALILDFLYKMAALEIEDLEKKK